MKPLTVITVKPSLILIMCLLLAVLVPVNPVSAENASVSTHARAAALIDVESGRLLYSSRGDEPMLIASLTKIMTAIVAIENGDLASKVKVGKNAFAKEGSSLYLKQGEEMLLEDMLYGLMLRSGNDAATAIAEHVGGSEQGFVYLMNTKAEELGLKNTHFANPHGLDAEGHYSSANDLAVLTAYALHNPVFKEIVGTQEKTADNPYEKWDYKWANKNKMLRLYEGADGVKTGYTKKALRCLVSSATRGGQQLVAVTLNDGNDWNDHAALLNFGFNHYPLKTLIERGEGISGYSFVTSRKFAYPLGQGEEARITTRLVLNEEPAARKKTVRGSSFGLKGTVVLQLGGKEIGRVPVYEPDRLPPEESMYMKRYSPAGTAAYPADNWLQALGSALRALLQMGRL
ncbi:MULTISPECIES: D-alanyl-D-alanine carboxypeptidase family protein [unclassified Paenibacillus]|uniref:D-alanyl-D-alanine carboxypeptidase family protein n=1 Tax=unclassified Paenibacillus TaxID=185978 RepID=UPI0024063805|nr:MULTISPECIES: D-alanyl-D-alanine carboxypeptidase family protein [unclassified Paenibacillus]MDF9840375.1 D-alanyl-D-alanine carboxypeptidase (penicillin-binding protein 5/6) [Paenibacillus sp. PastF-2]MDF9846957.1 D-alanyl-D-alanine carboxypeptidase (penicillin-binding protein 5/6) [Paenibacillus sp. PastM-2]MDF9853529.1 D-alanyl-D-alanine carboxypeptidase (penicillin-binding protein 5/6) [Paenibacillus sp. PastF-1]MDH6478985.1 D-alanyl-D-alanine carboxypeptidase (penicillin-binding protein